LKIEFQHLSENEKSEFGDDKSHIPERIEVLLRDELIDFSLKWPNIKKTIQDEYEHENIDNSCKII